MMVQCENGHGQGGYEYYFILFDKSTGNVWKPRRTLDRVAVCCVHQLTKVYSTCLYQNSLLSLGCLILLQHLWSCIS